MSLKKPKQKESSQVRELLSAEDDTVLFTFNIPKSLHKELKIKAVELDTSMTALIIAGVEDILSRK